MFSSRTGTILIILILIFILGDLMFLNVRILSDNKVNQNIPFYDNTQNLDTEEPQTISLPSNVCPNSCLTTIKEATSSIKITQITSAPKPTSAPTAATASSSTTYVKEFFIPFGGGSTNAGDWTDLAGASAYIDSKSYPNIKSVNFEASVRIPTGNQIAYVRLYNATDKHPVWYSDVNLEGGIPQLLTSKAITLDEGNKLYQVQMKTSLKYTAIVDQARLHIILN